MSRKSALAVVVAAMALLASASAPARASVSRPTQTSPVAGAAVQSAPAFAWTSVRRAVKYEVQIAGAGMSSPALAGQGDFYTRNTYATLTKAIPDGSYAWHVRTVGADGTISAWTAWRSFRKSWAAQPSLQTPAAGGSLTFPSTPPILRWSVVPGAAQYLVSVASDPLLSSLVFHFQNQDDPNGPPNIAATSAAIQSLPSGEYYWGVTPVDGEGNRGVASAVSSFTWAWPALATPTVTDLNPSAEVYDPKFSWTPVPGAARYEVEVNSSVDFSPGSKVCCPGTTLATSLSPTKIFKNGTYYWRVRALDPSGDAGPWNVGPVFNKTFDNVPPVSAPSIKNLHMRDNLSDPGVDQAPGTPGYQTQVPIVTWTPVPGASSYEVDVVPYELGACNWSAPQIEHWSDLTAANAWTPLGAHWNGIKPYSDPLEVANDGFTSLQANTSYCVRVRARTDRDTAGQDVYGDYSYLDHGIPLGPAFEWTPPAISPSPLSYPSPSDYVTPAKAVLTPRTPYFTWKPIAGAESYFVLVSKDANFTSLVDYGFTQIPAYAPRTEFDTRSYPDETTAYYWAVLPAKQVNGNEALGDPLLASAPFFTKQSVPPALVSPTPGQVFADQPTFRWTPAEGARRYELQVATDAKFGSLVDDVMTDATSYSSNTTYPADTVLYWRVRADDENLTGLAWSATGTFRKTLPAPVPNATNPTSGATLPVWTWAPVQGAAGYELSVEKPDGTSQTFSGIIDSAANFIKMRGLGIWHWRVRAEFPSANGSETPGPYSPVQSYTRAIGAPLGARTETLHNHVLLHWSPSPAAARYTVEIAATSDFVNFVEQIATDNTSYAPTMTGYGYRAGGPLYWRVAAVDSDGDQGTWTQPQRIAIQPRMQLSVFGTPRRGARSRLMLRIYTSTAQPLQAVLVRLTGPGVVSRAKRSRADGSVSFTVLSRKKGKLLFTATKRGYQTEYATASVQ